MFSADEARKQSADNIQRKIQEKLQEIEPLIKQAAQNGDRKLVTDEILCQSKDEYEFIKRVGQALVQAGYDVGMGTQLTSSCYVVYFEISW